MHVFRRVRRHYALIALVALALLAANTAVAAPSTAAADEVGVDAAQSDSIVLAVSGDPLADLEICSYSQPADSSGYGFIRIAGDNRYETAVEASKAGFPDGAPAVVIATGASWPDALGGAALAGVWNSPILLTSPTALPDVVLKEIRRLGASRAYVLGGVGAVSSAVQNTLEGELGSANVKRLGGSSRYETANLIAEEVYAQSGPEEWGGQVFIATGKNFPDALAAASLAWALRAPILLVPPESTMPLPSTVDWLDQATPTRAHILGGTSVVSEEVETYMDGRPGMTSVVRLAGADRYETSVAVAKYAVDTFSPAFDWDTVGIATGENFPDALAGGSTLGQWRAPLLLTRTNSVPGCVKETLEDVAYNPWNNPDGELGTIVAFGGTGALTVNVEGAVQKYVVF